MTEKEMEQRISEEFEKIWRADIVKKLGMVGNEYSISPSSLAQSNRKEAALVMYKASALPLMKKIEELEILVKQKIEINRSEALLNTSLYETNKELKKENEWLKKRMLLEKEFRNECLGEFLPPCPTCGRCNNVAGMIHEKSHGRYRYYKCGDCQETWMEPNAVLKMTVGQISEERDLFEQALQKVVEYDASFVDQSKGKAEMRMVAVNALNKRTKFNLDSTTNELLRTTKNSSSYLSSEQDNEKHT